MLLWFYNMINEEFCKLLNFQVNRLKICSIDSWAGSSNAFWIGQLSFFFSFTSHQELNIVYGFCCCCRKVTPHACFLETNKGKKKIKIKLKMKLLKCVRFRWAMTQQMHAQLLNEKKAKMSESRWTEFKQPRHRPQRWLRHRWQQQHSHNTHPFFDFDFAIAMYDR